MTENRFTVADRPDEARYVLLDEAADGGPAVIGEESYVDVPGEDDAVQRVLYHTGVSEDYAGQGLASVLVRAAVEDVIATGRRVVPVCPYVKNWLKKHPEHDRHVDRPRDAHLRAVRDASSS